MDIKSEIIEYISSKENNGALLITGQWGSGKSYLVKEIVNEINKGNNFAIGVVSLFGIENSSTLYSVVKNEYMEFSSLFLNKNALKAYRAIKRVANDSAKITSAALPESVAASAISQGVSAITSIDPTSFITVKKEVGIGENKKQFVLVFDDFERCQIKIPILMGIINDYNENRGIKTIVIADESKIKGKKYSEFKEKLIFRTLKLDSDYVCIVHSLIENFISDNEEYKSFLLQNEDCLYSVFTHSKYNNLRTFKSCIMDFERIFDVWKEKNAPIEHLQNILYKFCAITYECKKGKYGKAEVSYYKYSLVCTDEKEREEISNKYADEAFSLRYDSILDWIVEGNWNEDAFALELDRIYNVEEYSAEQRFLNISFWGLQQSDFIDGMPPVVERAYSGDLTLDSLITLLQKIHALNHNAISLPCEVNYERIKEGLAIRKSKIKSGEISEEKRRLYAELSEIDEEAKEIYNEIERIDSLKYSWDLRRKFIAYLKNQGAFSSYSFKDKCIDCFDVELLNLFYQAYSTALNFNKRELCWALTGLDYANYYGFDKTAKEKTINNFDKLIEMIKELSTIEDDAIATVIDNYVVEALEKKLKEIKDIDVKTI